MMEITQAKLVEYLDSVAPVKFPEGPVWLKGEEEKSAVHFMVAELHADGTIMLKAYDKFDRVADAAHIATLPCDGRYQIVNDAEGKPTGVIVFRPDTPNPDEERAWHYRIARS